MKMIEDHYGHIHPVKNAERILQGSPGCEPITDAPQVIAETGRVNAAEATTNAAMPKANGKARAKPH
ncbi:MAG: hypothetical protein ACLQIQ_22205 [Beijerinckiaceae bacterium]